MSRSLTIVAVALALSAAVAAPKVKEKPNSLVGEWVLESSTERAVTTRAEGLEKKWAFTADGRWLQLYGIKVSSEGRFASDPTASTATLDLQTLDAATRKHLCLYKIDGDHLTLVFGWDRAERPTTFDAPREGRRILYEFRRAKTE